MTLDLQPVLKKGKEKTLERKMRYFLRVIVNLTIMNFSRSAFILPFYQQARNKFLFSELYKIRTLLVKNRSYLPHLFPPTYLQFKNCIFFKRHGDLIKT